MRSKPLTTLAATIAIGLGFALTASPSAEASPRFTVVNEADASIKILIFNGDDSSCDIYAKKKTISSGKTETYGCTGNGKGRCKIVLRDDGRDICTKLGDTCGEYAIKVEGKSTVKITGKDGQYKCALS